MIIFPDIEIQDGRAVNRIRGREDSLEVYDVSPLDAACQFVAAGAEWLHVIDVDASLRREGRSNSGLIREIIGSVDVPVQVGGGIRTYHDVEWWLDHGAARVVLGTAAVVDRHLLLDVCGRYPSEIVISMTGKDGCVMIDGWRTRTSFSTLDLAKSFEASGAAAVIYTDLDRFEGGAEVGLASTIELGAQLEIPLISTGTVESLDDLSALALLPNIEGAIVGRALFEGTVDLREAIRTARAARIDPALAGWGVPPRLDEISGIPVKKIDHIGIFTSDSARSVAFYSRLGFELQKEQGSKKGKPILMRHPSGAAIKLFDARDPGEAHVQIALEVDSLSASRSSMEYHGIDVDNAYDYGVKGALYIRDPDGNVVELSRYRDLGGQERVRRSSGRAPITGSRGVAPMEAALRQGKSAGLRLRQ